MKEVVLKLDLHNDKGKHKVLSALYSLRGIDSHIMDMKEKKLTVIGDADPFDIVKRLRKHCREEILTVVPAKEVKKKEEPKTEEGKKEDEKKKHPNEHIAEPVEAYKAYYPCMTEYHHEIPTNNFAPSAPPYGTPVPQSLFYSESPQGSTPFNPPLVTAFSIPPPYFSDPSTSAYPPTAYSPPPPCSPYVPQVPSYSNLPPTSVPSYPQQTTAYPTLLPSRFYPSTLAYPSPPQDTPCDTPGPLEATQNQGAAV